MLGTGSTEGSKQTRLLSGHFESSVRDRHFKNCKQYEGKEQDAVRKCHRSLTQKNATFELRLVGIPWQSSAEDSMLSVLRAWVQSRVGELRCHSLRSTAKTRKRRPRTCKMSRS